MSMTLEEQKRIEKLEDDIRVLKAELQSVRERTREIFRIVVTTIDGKPGFEGFLRELERQNYG